MKIKKLASALAVTAALGIGMTGQARADALAEAGILISNFMLTNGAGTALTLGDFATVGFQDTLTNTAQLNGTPAFQFAFSNTFVASTDALQACVGTCPGENVYTQAGIPLTSTFARSDSILSGVPINGTGIGAAGVTANNIGQTSLQGNNTGSAGSQIQLTATFSFVLAKDIGAIGVQFNATDFIRTWTSAGSAFPSQAGASTTWSFVLKDGNTTLAAWEPNGSTATGTQTGFNVAAEACDLNLNSSATNNDPQASTNCSGAFAASSTFALIAGRSYSLTIAQNVNTQARAVQAVPEPGMLGLMGLGLAGIGFLGYRRRKAA